MATKYSDIIALRSQKAAYNIENEATDDWKSFIANDQFNDILNKVIASVRNNDVSMHKSFWISGTYGTGKSHAGAVIKHLLCSPVDEIRDYVEDEYATSKYDILRNSIFKLREQKQLFPVTLYGQSLITNKEDLSLVLQRAIKQSLTKVGIKLTVKTDFDNFIDHIEEEPDFWDMLINKNVQLKSIAPTRQKLISLLKNGDTSTFGKVHDALREGKFDIRIDNANLAKWFFEVQDELASKTNYSGLLVIWDEFTDVMTSPIGLSLLVALQEIDERVMAPQNNSYFLYISHPSALNSLKAEEREKTKGRYHYMSYNMEPVSAFKIMSGKFKVVGDEMEYNQLLENFYGAHPDLLNIYSSSSTNPEETRNDIRKLFPLHPSTANLATYYAREAGSSSRSVFQFIGENVAIRQFLDSKKQFVAGNTITADYLWDYVVGEFNENVVKYGAVTERFNSRKLQVENQGADFFAVFKSILLLNALNNIANNETVTPSEENIKNLFAGTIIEFKMDEILSYFDKNSIIQRLPGGLFSIQFSALPTKEIEDTKQQLMLTSFKFTSQIISFGDTAKTEMTKQLRLVNRANQFMFYSIDSNEYTLLNQIENGFKQVKPYEVFIAMLFARNTIELNELKEIAFKACNEDRFQNMAFIVFETTFGNDKYERFIEFQANATCAQKHSLPDQQKVHTKSAADMIKEWIVEIRRGNFTYYLNHKRDINAADKIVNTINACISPTIFYHGAESLDLIQTKSANSYWAKVSAKQVVDTILSYNTKTDITNKCTGVTQHVIFLLQDSVDENLKWKEDCDSNHPLRLVSEFIDKKFKYIDKNELFNLAQKLEDLTYPPFGLYQSYSGMAMVAFAMRKYVNQIFDNNGKPRTHQHLVDDVVELFKTWESGRQSNKLDFRFETKESRSLCKNFIDLFKLKSFKDYNDISSLTDARWAITHEFSTNVGYPLWSLKYITNLSDSVALPEGVKVLLDNILKICGESDMRNPILLNDTLTAIETYRFELGNLLNNNNNEFKTGFCNFLKLVDAVQLKNEEFNEAFSYIKKNLEATVGLWTESEVEQNLLKWRIQSASTLQMPLITDPFESVQKPQEQQVPEEVGIMQKKRVMVKGKVAQISDINKAKKILDRIIDNGNENIINIINSEL